MFIKGSIVNIEFEHHINLIGGNLKTFEGSGVNKTFLFSSMSDAYENGLLFSDKNLHFFDKIMSMHGISFSSKDCIIVDEFNYAPSELNSLLKMVRDTRCYLIVIGRLYIKQLEYSVDSVYAVTYEEHKHYFRLKHLFTPTVCDENIYFAGVATEDSTSVASIYSDVLNTEVMPVFGRSNFYNAFKRFKTTDILLIADRAKFGPELSRLINRLQDKFKDKATNIYLYLPECFEQICVDLIDIPVFTDIDEYFDAEEMYEDILQNQCNIKWGKANIRDCIAIFRSLYDFEDSKIMHDLRDVYSGKMNSKYSLLYIVPLENKIVNEQLAGTKSSVF